MTKNENEKKGLGLMFGLYLAFLLPFIIVMEEIRLFAVSSNIALLHESNWTGQLIEDWNLPVYLVLACLTCLIVLKERTRIHNWSKVAINTLALSILGIVPIIYGAAIVLPIFGPHASLVHAEQVGAGNPGKPDFRP